MEPATICSEVLGSEKLATILAELTTSQFKSILKEGQFKIKSRSGFVPQKEKRRIWSDKILSAIQEKDDNVASGLLQQWLLFHRRQLLIDYLDDLGIKHRDGETDDNFLVDGETEKIHKAAESLLNKNDAREVVAYLRYIAFQQQSDVFEDWAPPEGK